MYDKDIVKLGMGWLMVETLPTEITEEAFYAVKISKREEVLRDA